LRNKRVVSTEDAMAYAESNSLAFVETSALEATGVDDAFRQILTGEVLFSSFSMDWIRVIGGYFQKFTD
jgi:hypothetical protein